MSHNSHDTNWINLIKRVATKFMEYDNSKYIAQKVISE